MLKQLREFFQPLLRSLAPCAHVVMLGRAPEGLDDPLASVAQRALEGFSRSLAKELRNGATAQLLYVAPMPRPAGRRPALLPLAQECLHLGPGTAPGSLRQPGRGLDPPTGGRRALVTGAARGIGAAIAETLARDGAEVLLLDVPQASQDLDALAARLGGKALPWISAPRRRHATARGLPDGIDIVVHNAGITRDKTLANMTPEYWDAVLAVNLKARSADPGAV
jgi:3-oxoacyl-[acyl-carrier protein] reductase